MTHFIGITDYNNQRFIVEVPDEVPAGPGSLSVPRTATMALKLVRQKIIESEPIDCTIVHSNNKAKMTVIFLAAVRVDVAREP